jgi:hypothetical protein
MCHFLLSLMYCRYRLPRAARVHYYTAECALQIDGSQHTSERTEVARQAVGNCCGMLDWGSNHVSANLGNAVYFEMDYATQS